jgi:hypothetical protein
VVEEDYVPKDTFGMKILVLNGYMYGSVTRMSTKLCQHLCLLLN